MGLLTQLQSQGATQRELRKTVRIKCQQKSIKRCLEHGIKKQMHEINYSMLVKPYWINFNSSGDVMKKKTQLSSEYSQDAMKTVLRWLDLWIAIFLLSILCLMKLLLTRDFKVVAS